MGLASNFSKVGYVSLMILCLVLGLTALAVFGFFGVGPHLQPKNVGNAPVQDSLHTSSLTAKTTPVTQESHSPTLLPASSKPQSIAQLPTPDSQKEAICSRLIEYASSYEATSLPLIAPYLTSNDREIRDAAVNAIVVLGDASGGAILRNAAASIKDPREAAAMLDQADYVELPRVPIQAMPKLNKKAVH